MAVTRGSEMAPVKWAPPRSGAVADRRLPGAIIRSMGSHISIVTLVVLAPLLLCSPGPAETIDFSGEWINQSGSLLKLKHTDTSVEGTFISGVGTNNQQIVAPVVGWADGDRIAFTVVYQQFGSVVAWVGQVVGEPDNPELDTTWLHELEVSDDKELDDAWASTRTGSDRFKRKSQARPTP